MTSVSTVSNQQITGRIRCSACVAGLVCSVKWVCSSMSRWSTGGMVRLCLKYSSAVCAGVLVRYCIRPMLRGMVGITPTSSASLVASVNHFSLKVLTSWKLLETSPDKSWTTSPDKSRTTSPDKSRTTSPDKSWTTSPDKSRTTSPDKSRTTSPDKSWTTSRDQSNFQWLHYPLLQRSDGL